MMYTASNKVSFFDTLAKQWDEKLDLPALRKNLVKALKPFDIQPGEHVVDIGCGTGNLTQALLDVLGPEGKVTAVEVSMDMLLEAQKKISDPRMLWQIADVEWPLPFKDDCFDRLFFYQVWPHLQPQEAMLKEFLRVLKSGGQLHIWHTDSREAVNQMHAKIKDPAVASDVLPPAEEVADLLKKAGFMVSQAAESDKDYLVSARKP
ncbi:MAG: class I SAM-dependent methyltransferase [Brachymonas sp.]|nr:class I SAM-dependent methyltransferase [Brachymonas sp.]